MTQEIHKGLVGLYVDESSISKVDIENKSLIYRGYPVHELAENCSFEEVAFLLWNGELPTATELEEFTKKERGHRQISDDLLKVCSMFQKDAHPMATLRTAVSFLGTEDDDWSDMGKPALHERALRMMAKIPTIIAATYRYSQGKEPIAPRDDLTFAENFFHMYFGEVPEPEIVRCFNISLILYAEHGFNVSTFTARTITSSLSGMYSAVTGAIGSLKGPLHGGANEAVMDMMIEIDDPAKAKDWMLNKIKNKEIIMGFGHRVYKYGDSRVPLMTKAYHDVARIKGDDKWVEMSKTLEETMVGEKKIYPNLDFPAGPAYYLMGFDIPIFTPIFVMSRITGWTAHVIEQLDDNKLIRPLCEYTGPDIRPVSPIGDRQAA